MEYTIPLFPPVSFLDNSTSCIYYPTVSLDNHHPIDNTIKIYPNPITTSLNITASEIITNLTISNLLGQTLYDVKYNSLEAQLNVADLQAGTYIIKINNTKLGSS